MTGGGFARLPDGSVIVALSLPRPSAHEARDVRDVQDVRDARDTCDMREVRDARDMDGVRVGAAPAWPWRRPAGATAPPERPERRRWSAHADEAHTVRPATPALPGIAEEPRVRVLVHAGNRARALTRLRNLGLRAVYLRGNAAPPTPDEITAVLHHPDGLVWRANPGDDTESWHPIAALLRHSHRTRTAWEVPTGSLWPGES